MGIYNSRQKLINSFLVIFDMTKMPIHYLVGGPNYICSLLYCIWFGFRVRSGVKYVSCSWTNSMIKNPLRSRNFSIGFKRVERY